MGFIVVLEGGFVYGSFWEFKVKGEVISRLLLVVMEEGKWVVRECYIGI